MRTQVSQEVFVRRFLTIFPVLAWACTGGLALGSETVEIDGQFQLGRLGESVSGIGDIDGDGLIDFVVGAPGHTDFKGAVRVISGENFDTLFMLLGESPGDRFGQTVAGIGDVDQDLINDFAVGAPTNDATGASSGKVYLYSGRNAALIDSIDGPINGARFGSSLAGLTDLDLDFVPDFAVGAPEGGFRLPGGPSMSANGAVFVYSGATRTLIYSFFGQASGDRLGSSVARINDQNGDLINDLVVGAPRADVTHESIRYTDNGKVYLLSGAPVPDGSPDGSPLLQVLTNPDHLKSFSYLGWSVSRIADIDMNSLPGQDDLIDDLLVGAPGAGTDSRGRAYLFRSDREFAFDGLNTYDPSGEPFLEASDPWTLQGDAFSEQFGHSITSVGNLQHSRVAEPVLWPDRTPTFAEIAGGDPEAFNPAIPIDGSEAGKVWVFDGWDWSARRHLAGGDELMAFDGDQRGSQFGHAVSGCGHPSDYGMARLLMGAPEQDFELPVHLANAGRVTVFTATEGSVLHFGVPCDSSNGVYGPPRLTVRGSADTHGKLRIVTEHGLPGATYFLVVGRHQGSVPLAAFGSTPGCAVHMDPRFVFIVGPLRLDGNGRGLIKTSRFKPSTLILQSAVEIPLGVGSLSFSNGVELSVH